MNRTQICNAVFLSAALLALSACGDKSLDDYKQDQVNRDLGKLSKAQGSYSGLLKRQATNSQNATQASKIESSMGALKITLTPEIAARTSSNSAGNDNTRSDSKAVLRAEIEFRARDVLRFTIPDSAFSPESGTFGVTFNPSGGTSADSGDQLTIDGVIQDSVFNGTIRSLSSDVTAEFSLTRDGNTTQQLAASIPGMLSATPGVAPGTSVTRTLSGTTHLLLSGSTPDLPVNLMILDSKDTSPSAELVSLFAPTRTVQMSFTYGGDLSFNFKDVLWDNSNETLTANGALNAADGSPQLVTECRWTSETHLSCTHASGNVGVIATSEFEAGSPKSLRSPFDGSSGPSIAKSYTGTTKFLRQGVRYTELPANLVLVDPTSSASESLRRLFTPVGSVQATLSYGGGMGFVINDAHWDRQSGRITGSDPTKLSLDCTPTDGKDSELICRHISNSEGVVAISTLHEAQAPELKSPFGNVASSELTACGTASASHTGTKPSWIKVVQPAHTPQDEFNEQFFAKSAKMVQIGLDLFADGNAPVSFNSASYDPDQGTLAGSSTQQSPVSSALAMIQCSGFSFAPLGKPFKCTYSISSLFQSFTLEYDPKSTACMKPSTPVAPPPAKPDQPATPPKPKANPPKGPKK